MEKSRSLSIAVRGLFVSAFLSTIFGVVNASAYTVTYNANGALFDNGQETNVVEYDDDHNVVSGQYKIPEYFNPDDILFYWSTDQDGNNEFLLDKQKDNIEVYGQVINLEYDYATKTSSYNFTTPFDGNFKIQLWGSMGNKSDIYWSALPGHGAYTSGKINLARGLNLYIFVGDNKSISGTRYTFNGGGSGEQQGGGATDIRLIDGEWDNPAGLASRIMVAAGAGGGITQLWYLGGNPEVSQQGHAGGLEGYSYLIVNNNTGDYYQYSGHGGTQTAGGAGGTGGTRLIDASLINGEFGKGGSGIYNFSNSPASSGGGGGYYGGGHGIHPGSSHTGGGGGSSYISGHDGCLAITSETDLAPKTDSIHYSGLYFTDTVMIDGAGYSWTTTKGNEVVGMPKIDNTGTEAGHKGTGYAKILYENLKYSITYKVDDEIEQKIWVEPDAIISAKTMPERSGYTFAWYLNSDEFDFSTPITENIELVGKYTPIIYNLSYNLGIGTLSESNPSSYTIETDDITLNNPSKDYYTFLGWSGTGLTGNRNKTVTIAKGSTGDRAYTANYTPIPYTITYNLDGGTNGANNPTAYTYESDEIALARPTKEGYTFTGYSGTDIDGEDNLDVTIPAQSHGDREYTAHWSINQYTATFDVNGGTAINPSTITSDYGVAFGTLPTTSRTGYGFDGWFTEQTGGSEISDTTTMPAEDHTYYAHWTIQTFNISYDLNGGELAQGTSNPDTYTYESTDINLAKPSREGYTFLGWSGTDLTDNIEDVTIAHNSLGDRSYKAEFQINEYTATFDANAGETADPETITKNYDEELGNLPATSRLGYTFLGWFTDTTAGDKITDTTKMPAGDVTYYAHWEIITYTIEYDLGGEDMDSAPNNDSSNPTSYTVEDADITLKAATPGDTWHYFVGWALDRDTEEGLSDNFVIDTAEAKNIKVYAIFQANPYTVTLDPGNGDDKIVKTVRGDQEIGELPTPERAGYEFLGWFVGDKQIDEHFHPRSDSIAVARWEEIPTVPDTGANSTPNTGDAIMNHIVTFAVCIFALFIVVVLRKRKAKNEA